MKLHPLKMLTLAVAMVVGLTASAFANTENTLKRVEAQYVCMVNDTAFSMPQITVPVGDKTYYGCCEMCKARLAQDRTVRMAKDPVSGKEVDKATAIIGAHPTSGQVFYFENMRNLRSYRF